MEEFFRLKRNKVGSGMRSLEQSMEQIQINNQWRNDHEESIRDWLSEHHDKKDKTYKDLFNLDETQDAKK